MDIANRLVETTAAGIDTWNSPEHYEKNRATVGDFLGRGLLDYVAFGSISVGGFSAGQMLFLRDDATALYSAFRNSEIPKLTKISFNRAIAGEEPVDSEAGKLFMSQKNNVVRIENESGFGSGFFVDKEEGLVTTNYHVVRAAKKHTFSMEDGSEFSASLVARDKFADIAVLRPLADTPKIWPEVEFGSTADLTPGSNLHAVGHPAGLAREVCPPENLRS